MCPAAAAANIVLQPRLYLLKQLVPRVHHVRRATTAAVPPACTTVATASSAAMWHCGVLLVLPGVHTPLLLPLLLLLEFTGCPTACRSTNTEAAAAAAARATATSAAYSVAATWLMLRVGVLCSCSCCSFPLYCCEKSVAAAQMYKVHLECQQQVIETQAAPMRQNCCYFNEMFSFEILKREGGLRLCVLRVDGQEGGAEELVGDCVILLDQLADQKKHEMTKEVWGAQKSEIVLSCQWIYSKKLLYETYLSEFSMRRDAKLREISDYQIELDKLNMPFQDSERQGYPGGLLGAYNLGADYLSKLLDQLRVYLKLGGWLPTSHHMTAITFWLACVAGYTRAVCLDQLVAAFVFWNNIDPRRWTVERYSFLMLCSACGIVLDICWIKTYFSAWSTGSVESDMHNITKIFSIFLCVWKVLLYLLFWKCRHDLKKKIAHGSQLSTASAAYAPAKMEESLTTSLQHSPTAALHSLPSPGA